MHLEAKEDVDNKAQPGVKGEEVWIMHDILEFDDDIKSECCENHSKCLDAHVNDLVQCVRERQNLVCKGSYFRIFGWLDEVSV